MHTNLENVDRTIYTLPENYVIKLSKYLNIINRVIFMKMLTSRDLSDGFELLIA